MRPNARRILIPMALAAGMLLAVTLSALAVSTLGTRYSFEDATAQGWAGSATCTVGYHGTSNCKGSYCWYCTDVSGTHTYVTTTYEIEQAGIYYLDAYYKRRGYYRLYSASTDVDGYGVDEIWAPPSWDPAWDVWWQAANTYMALVTGTWSIGTENWGTYTTRSFDYARLAWYGDSRQTSTGLVCDGHFRAPYTSNWTLYDPNGNSGYWSTYGYGAGAGAYDIDLGSMRLYTDDRLTTTITVPEDAGAISLSYGTGWTVLGAKYLLYNDAGALLDSHGNLGSTCAGSWCARTDSWGALAPGSYDLVFTTSGDGFLDSVTVNCANPDVCVASDCTYAIGEPPPEPEYWSPAAWVYYPLEEASELGVFQDYGDSTLYGSPYEFYNIWATTGGATVYAIAQMEITDVGVNALGHYVTGQIDAWPDVPSTTLKYEGLSGVSVAVGDRVGASCPIGKVSRRWEMSGSVYHLLLGVWFPDAATPFDPVPYMARRPAPDLCQLTPKDPGGGSTPGYGSGPAGLWEPVCTDCTPPGLDELMNIGKWIDWLGCVFTNLVTCTLVRILNTMLNWIYAGIMAAINGFGWLASAIDAILEFVGSFWNAILRVALTNLVQMVLNLVFGADLVKDFHMAAAIANAIVDGTEDMLDAFMSYFLGMGMRFGSFAQFAIDFVTAVGSVFDVEAVDIFDFAGFAETGGGAPSGIGVIGAGGDFSAALAATGPNDAKALYLAFLGLFWIDYQLGAHASLDAMMWLFYGVTAWAVIWWTIKQFEQLAETS